MSEIVVRQEQSLGPITAAKQLIARAVLEGDAGSLTELRSRASAFELYHRRAGARDVANDAGEVKVRAERGLGQLDAAENPHGRPEKGSPTGTFSLDGLRRETRAAWRKLGALDDEEFDRRLAVARADEDSGVSTARLLLDGDDRTTAERLVASDENEWYTPTVYVDAARVVLGGIDLDPATSNTANSVVQATTYYTDAEDGLAQPWSGRVWLNPPYGRLAGDFTRKLLAEHEDGTVTAAVLLVNAHCTDTSWFQPLWDYVLCFTNHRIDFDSAGREKATTSTHGSVFVYLGDATEEFNREFSQFGAVVKRA